MKSWKNRSTYSKKRPLKGIKTQSPDGKRDSQISFHQKAEVYRALFEHAGYGISLVDLRTGKPILFNKKAHEDLGYTGEEYTTLNTGDLIIDSEGSFQKHITEIFYPIIFFRRSTATEKTSPMLSSNLRCATRS